MYGENTITIKVVVGGFILTYQGKDKMQQEVFTAYHRMSKKVKELIDKFPSVSEENIPE